MLSVTITNLLQHPKKAQQANKNLWQKPCNTCMSTCIKATGHIQCTVHPCNTSEHISATTVLLLLLLTGINIALKFSESTSELKKKKWKNIQ